MANLLLLRAARAQLARRLGLDAVTAGWAVVTAGSVSRLALGLVSSVLIARALGPAEFGVFATLAAITSIVGAVADFGLTESGVRHIASVWEANPWEARARGRSLVWLRLTLALVILVAGTLATLPLAHRLDWLAGRPYLLPLALLGVAATALSGAVSALLQATGLFGRLTVVMLVNSGLTALLAVALAWMGQLNLLTALGILGVATALVSFSVGRRLLPPPWPLPPPTFGRLWSDARPLFAFGRWLWVANMLAMLAASLDLFLVGRWAALSTVGLYALAVNLASKVDVVNQSLYAVSLPTASSVTGDDGLARYVRRSLVRSSLIGVGLLPLFWLVGPFVQVFYGAAYLPAVGTLRLLLGVVLFDVLTVPLTLLAFPLNQPRLLAAADAVRVLALGVTGAWLIPTLGVTGGVLARLSARVAGAALILTALALRYLSRHMPGRP